MPDGLTQAGVDRSSLFLIRDIQPPKTKSNYILMGGGLAVTLTAIFALAAAATPLKSKLGVFSAILSSPAWTLIIACPAGGVGLGVLLIGILRHTKAPEKPSTESDLRYHVDYCNQITREIWLKKRNSSDVELERFSIYFDNRVPQLEKSESESISQSESMELVLCKSVATEDAKLVQITFKNISSIEFVTDKTCTYVHTVDAEKKSVIYRCESKITNAGHPLIDFDKGTFLFLLK